MDFDLTPVDALDKVPEPFRPLYKEGDDGKFAVNPDYKPLAEAVVGLNRSLKAARLEAKNKTTVDLSPLSEFGEDPTAIRDAVNTKLKELQDELAKGGDAKLNLDKIKGDLAAAHAKELEKANKRGEALQGQLYGLLVENAATSAVAEAKGVPELLLPFIKNQVKVVEQDGEFKVFVVDAAGDQRYSGITGQPMTIKELVAEMKTQEKFGRLFESEAGGGGGGTPPGSGRRPASQQREGEPRSSMDKIAAGLRKRAGGR